MNTVLQSDIAYFQAKCKEIGQKLFGIDAIIHSLMELCPKVGDGLK